ncbi:hypothetical protein [Carboxylicivirga marina]|uniref:hypothetical protein n=1 Tax=Carboxylicivirga marina TaxID=2800988 RepID=UPI00259475AF|nr:hypothetical protein [uncultured Carboxylicivirga sp.]
MIDYIKATITGLNPAELLENPLLNFCYQVNLNTGAIRDTKRNGKKCIPHQTAYFKSMQFIIYDSGTIILDGSLHKYWNDGKHNFNDFNIAAIDEVLQDIQQKFKIASHQMLLRQIEIGVNIIPPCSTVQILKHCFQHRKQSFAWSYVPDEGKYIQVEHSQYFIKIYDKAKHYRKKGFDVGANEKLRFEIKYSKLEKLKKHQIYTVDDLIKYGLSNFSEVLTDEWANVLFYDFTIQSKSRLIDKFNNPYYWDELRTKGTYYKQKNRLKEFISNDSNNIASDIENRIRQKCIELTQKGTRIDQYQEPFKNKKGTQNDCLYIQSKDTPQPLVKHCLITHVDISMQRNDSLLLSHTGLKYYLINDINTYNRIKNKYLPKQWLITDEVTQIKMIAHNIRCKKTNIEMRLNKLNSGGQISIGF